MPGKQAHKDQNESENLSTPDSTSENLTEDLLEDEESHDARDRKWRWWSRLSYTTRVTLAFALIAAMTALVAIGVVSLVWEQHFKTYTRENIQRVADTTASQIMARYETDGSFSSYVLQPAAYMVSVTSGIGMQVVDNDNHVLYDSTMSKSSDSVELPSLAPQQNNSNMARSAIIVNDRAIGSVRVWVYGSDTLLRSTDVEFRNQSYSAMATAAVIAIVLALIIGSFFARSLGRSIRRIANTADAIREGDLSARTGMVGPDEVSQLGETFDAMAESMERDRELERRLTTDVAHELRTPLMAIQATVEAMVDGVFPADEQHLVTVNSEVQRLSRLVDSLLKLSRLENRSNPTKRVRVNIGELIQGIITTHDAYVRESGLTLHYRADKDVYVYGNPDMIRQATANLISNAVRYTPVGGSIFVWVRKSDTLASIAVQDTGIGLTPEEAKMVFSRFWRADSGRARTNGGLGIGLSVVKEIVNRHDGWIQVEGEKDKGSCFTIYIPLYDEREVRRIQREAENKARAEQREAERARREAKRAQAKFERTHRDAKQPQDKTGKAKFSWPPSLNK